MEFEYKGFKSIIQFDEEEQLYKGKVVGQPIAFEGKTERICKNHAMRSIDAFIDFQNGVR